MALQYMASPPKQTSAETLPPFPSAFLSVHLPFVTIRHYVTSSVQFSSISHRQRGGRHASQGFLMLYLTRVATYNFQSADTANPSPSSPFSLHAVSFSLLIHLLRILNLSLTILLNRYPFQPVN